ncbi:hypothetical protein [Sandaracinus amylolyticus]|uniref:Uncharacterized protein n=1 Tax=Sandaracinus amylolyticus TaxID=927083 RepID=A0A0F6W9R7_9BACT|nr:hypothetical protein [Sandaracinus amylolyticus]AKF10990.1 hypothetical protein DB32_008139 [Sandaracinus amylolyticus]
MTEIVPIASLREGSVARVRGRVRRAHEVITSSLGQRACVYWDVRQGLASAPHAHGAVDFWLEDASGRVLIRAASMRVEARAQRREEVLGQVARDIDDVSRRQRAVKDAIRRGEGGTAKALHAERRRLAELATLLCAMRAHARGRVHVGGSLQGQDAWIRAHAETAESGPGASTLRLVIEQWEVVLEERDEVEIEGECALEAAPPGTGPGGYRERASCLALRAPSGGTLEVRGVGATGAGEPIARHPSRRAPPVVPERPATDPGRVLTGAVAVVVGVLVLLAWLTR